MRNSLVAAAMAATFLSCVLAPESAAAQVQATGSELIGHTVRVEFADGTTNQVHFHQNGQARVVGQAGRELPAQWFVQNQQLCLQTAAARECWPYQARFQAGQPVVLTSDCAVTSRWTALSTQPVQPPPTQHRAGERG